MGRRSRSHDRQNRPEPWHGNFGLEDLRWPASLPIMFAQLWLPAGNLRQLGTVSVMIECGTDSSRRRPPPTLASQGAVCRGRQAPSAAISRRVDRAVSYQPQIHRRPASLPGLPLWFLARFSWSSGPSAHYARISRAVVTSNGVPSFLCHYICLW